MIWILTLSVILISLQSWIQRFSQKITETSKSNWLLSDSMIAHTIVLHTLLSSSSATIPATTCLATTYSLCVFTGKKRVARC